MNLQPISAPFFIKPRIIGWCTGKRQGGACNEPVKEGDGFADLDGEPFKAYYCGVCGAAIRASLAATRPYFNVKDPS